MSFSVAPHLDGLADLARRPGVDIRPILVRVLTDLYVQKEGHSAEEEQHYVEIMLRFVNTADRPTRINVSRKLAVYPAAPRAVLNRLARDCIEVAEPLLQNPTNLTAADLLAIAAECGGRHATLIAQKLGHSRDSVQIAGAPQTAPLAPTHQPSSGEAAMDPAPPPFADIARQFLAADSGERRRMLGELSAGASQCGPADMVGSEAMQKLERFALLRRLDEFTTALQQTLALSRSLAARIVQDDSGELLVVCLRSIAMPPNVHLRVLLFLNPVIGQSVDQVYELGKLFEITAESAAAQIVRGFQIVSQAEMSDAAEQQRSVSDPSHGRHSPLEGARAASHADSMRLSASRPERIPPTDRRYGTT